MNMTLLDLIRERSSVSKDGRYARIVLGPPKKSHVPSWKKDKLVPVSKNVRQFFPARDVSFIIETDIGEITTHIVGDSAERGDPEGGTYFSTNMHPWYESHKELSPGDVLIVTKVSDRRYKLDIEKK